MHRLSSIIWLVLLPLSIGLGQSPHGEALKLDCVACHNTSGWEIPANQWLHEEKSEGEISKITGMPIIDSIALKKFKHNNTSFPLTGTHKSLDCKMCHETLVFNTAPSDCASCHTDQHNMTVGNDCARCHNTESWLINSSNLRQIHDSNGFSLTGNHTGIDCIDCHTSASQLSFERIGNDCFNCHRTDYESTMSPDHTKAGFDKDCTLCHNINGTGWMTDIIDHSFFPLTLGHDIIDCKKCHTSDSYSDISADCISCHKTDFENTKQPDHQLANFSIDCKQCHTTNPGWMPAEYKAHDAMYFPIYSGKHNGVWNDCVECHTSPSDYSIFSCTICHTNPETDNEHEGIGGYIFDDAACLACHPNGDKDNAFDHSTTNFPLTGEHLNTECVACHANGFAGTPTQCSACHSPDFNATMNPNHVQLNIPMDCAACHTTDPDWMPATFGIHDQYYALHGAHALIANDCVACHNGDYNNTPNTCVGCHLDDFNGTTNPNHQQSQFSTDCTTCHTENAWIPSTFDHDGQYFPIYSGKHKGEWNQCTDCHTNPQNFQEFTCITCHTNPETNEEHAGVGGYQYNSLACLACHPNGDADNVFDHSQTAFQLTGVHNGPACIECHSNGYIGTSTECVSCHQSDFNGTQNPNHQSIGISTDCAACHNTIDADWMPASFNIHNTYYELLGAHAAIANDCAACHNGEYNNTPNTCVGCHLNDYNATTDPNHSQAQFNQDCTQCHTQSAWEPSTFDHDGQYFPIYSGKHKGEWNQCTDCHTNPQNYQEFTCITCHTNPETDNEHQGIGGYQYNSPACLACHPNGDADNVFDHSQTAFQLTGVHNGPACIECHSNGYIGTSTECVSCHQSDFNGTQNPNHQSIGISTDCAACHSTFDADWSPASFGIHDNYYALTGAHVPIANDCATCHNGDYNNTPNTCIGCHTTDFSASTNPNHTVLNLPMDCVMCHTTEPEWMPASFPIHDDFYVLEGAHAAIANDCAACHNGEYNNTPNTCVGCHLNDYNTTSDPNHVQAQFNQDCTQCHTQSAWEPSTFDHDGQYFPIYSGKHNGEWNQCTDCHTNPQNYQEFTCITCHTNPETNEEHEGVGGYQYNSPACLACHPNGDADNNFDHNNTSFPLTGAHIGTDCIDCHASGYQGTSTECVSCHQTDFNGSLNPNHQNLNIPTDCASCHTTDAGWSPATFGIHDNYYALTGAHVAIANDCATCHNGDYNNTPNTCVGCHSADFSASTDPNHPVLNLPMDCVMCHTTEPDWMPASFPIHDDFYLLEGAHAAIANDCAACHNGEYNNTPNTCVGCHLDDYNATTDPNHVTNQFDQDCTNCHNQIAWIPSTFDHNNIYVLDGAHALIADNCIACHIGGYNNTPNTCAGCHQQNYDQSMNPNHSNLNLSNDCTICHTTDPDWMPASFPVHDDFYVLEGAHAAIANDCVTCHNGDYNNTPNTCVGCHQTDYNNTNNPDHSAAQFPTDCESCHSQNTWTPANWDHDNMYFPIYSGKHDGEWNTCVDCHLNTNDYSIFSCIDCHEHDNPSEVANDHENVSGYSYNSNACYSCHPDGSD